MVDNVKPYLYFHLLEGGIPPQKKNQKGVQRVSELVITKDGLCERLDLFRGEVGQGKGCQSFGELDAVKWMILGTWAPIFHVSGV